MNVSDSAPVHHVNPADVFAHHLDLPPPGEPLDRKAFPSHGGVLAFTDQRHNIIQTLSAENIRRSAEFRLQPPPESKRRGRADLRSVARRLWWIPTHSRFETMLVYLGVARRIQPRDYQQQLAFGPAWFISINLHERLPRWRVGCYAFAPQTQDIGPFDTRRKAADFASLLEDLFDLCRDYEVLEQVPHGRPCVYFEMGRCPAPCNGSVSLDDYRDTLAASVRFAAGDQAQRLAQLEAEMRRAADDRAFPRAAGIKQLLARARRTLQKGRPITPTPGEFGYLIVQRGEKRSLIKPFFANAGRIEAGTQVPLKQVSRHGTEWLARLRRPSPDASFDPVHLSENIWLVAHFLGRGDQIPGLFVPASAALTPDKLVAAVQERFAPSPQGATSDNAPPASFSIDQNP